MPSTEQLTKLRTLANFLDDLPHDKFHMPQWASPDASEDACGTAGCAAGWAATVFKKEGWSFAKGSNWTMVQWNNLRGSFAFGAFFGLDRYEARWITTDFVSYLEEFGVPADDITPRMAAKRIRDVIEMYDPSMLEEQTVVEETINV